MFDPIIWTVTPEGHELFQNGDYTAIVSNQGHWLIFVGNHVWCGDVGDTWYEQIRAMCLRKVAEITEQLPRFESIVLTWLQTHHQLPMSYDAAIELVLHLHKEHHIDWFTLSAFFGLSGPAVLQSFARRTGSRRHNEHRRINAYCTKM